MYYILFHLMFEMCCCKFNQPIGKGDVSNVERMDYMFELCTSFNQPIDLWNVSAVRTMCYMFSDCKLFDQHLNNWDISGVRDMRFMFNNCSNFSCQNIDIFKAINCNDCSNILWV